MTGERLVYRGKSKDVLEVSRGPHAGKYRLVFTDRATGYVKDGKVVFDPGRDQVVGEIPGKGAIACRFATRFFRLLKERGIPSHHIATVADNEMIVEPAAPLSMPAEAPEVRGAAPLLNLEFTWRNNAAGSFWRRYPFVRPCRNLGRLVEIWTKGESDVLITREALAATGAMSDAETDESIRLVRQVAEIVTREFAARGLHVVDGKLELGRIRGGDGGIVVIDEISPDVLRVCKGYAPDAQGHCTAYADCAVTGDSGGGRTIVNRRQVPPAELAGLFPD